MIRRLEEIPLRATPEVVLAVVIRNERAIKDLLSEEGLDETEREHLELMLKAGQLIRSAYGTGIVCG